MDNPEDLIVTDAELRRQLPTLAEELGIGGSGVEQVSGTVTLDGSGDPIREFFTTAATSFVANGTSTLISSYTAVVWRRTGAGSWGYQLVQDSWTTPAATPDTTAPVAGTLAVTVTDVKADLSVSGASDDRGLVEFSFSRDNGATWTGWQAESTYSFTGLTASTPYTFKHRVRDAAGNITTGTAVAKTTAAAPPGWSTVRLYDFAGVADGTAANGLTPTVGTGALTAGSSVTVVGQALDVYPYGNTQSWSTPDLTHTAARFRASMDVTAPADSAVGVAGDVKFVVKGGASPSKGAGNYEANVFLNTPTASATTLSLSVTSTYDGAPVVTMQGGKSQTGFPRTGAFTLDRVSDRELQVLVDGALWATIAPAEAGATFGQKSSVGGHPANKYQGAHWKIDNIRQEVYS